MLCGGTVRKHNFWVESDEHFSLAISKNLIEWKQSKIHRSDVLAHYGCKIPRTIHFIWLGSPLPTTFAYMIDSFRRLHDSSVWDIKIWNDDDDLLSGTLESCFKKAANYGMKSDILRYEVINSCQSTLHCIIFPFHWDFTPFRGCLCWHWLRMYRFTRHNCRKLLLFCWHFEFISIWNQQWVDRVCCVASLTGNK